MKTLTSATDLGELLQQFFFEYLINQRRVSPHTVASYRDSFLLLLSFVAHSRKKSLPKLMMADLDANMIIHFLHYRKRQTNDVVAF